MGCVGSKTARPVTPPFGSSCAASASASGDIAFVSASASSIWSRPPRIESYEFGAGDRSESGESGKVSSNGTHSTSSRLGNLHRYIEGEMVAAGWPAWLSAVAGEAVQGWLPLKAESFEKLEKIGQGTYSSVFRARDLETGRTVALKKVRFDNFEPESVRFMAREILVLRRLNHPNVIKLEGLIASRMSCSMYLVFEYMEHDLAGLTSSPDIKFSEAQIKCYMHQLLSGLEHCHSRGVMHRDIKCANLLINNEGILKMADFGLANFFSPGQKQPLTSRVVTLWYRPPELLLGSTKYDVSVDLWSVGCVFAEMFMRKPILQGRTEVEQIHKIFKLCGSPPDEYWRRLNMAQAAVFKPQQPYENHLKETFKCLPETAFRLLETLLSVEPNKRGTASNALVSEYFKTKPYACDPSSLPEYAPNKEIDAKFREDMQRRRITGRNHNLEASKRLSRAHKSSLESNGANQRHVHAEETLTQDVRRGSIAKQDRPRASGEIRLFVDLQPVPAINKRNDGRCMKQISQGDLPFSVPSQISAPTGFAWAQKAKEELSYSKSNAKSCMKKNSIGPLTAMQDRTSNSNLKGSTNGDLGHVASASAKGHMPFEMEKQEMLKQWTQVADAFDSSGGYSDPMETKRKTNATALKNGNRYKDKGERVEFSGPLLSQSHRVDELLQKHEQQIRRVVRRSWFRNGSK